MLNARPHIFKIEKVFVIDTLSITHCNADLTDASQTFGDQRFVPVVERLVSAEKECGRLSGIEHGTKLLHRLFGPVFRTPVAGDMKIDVIRWDEHSVRILERP